MKFTVIIAVVVLCLIGFTGIVSAEVGLVQVYGEGEALYDKTKVEPSSSGSSNLWVNAYQVGDIIDYQSVNRISTLIKQPSWFSPSQMCKYAEFDFVASVGGVAIGSGRGYFSRIEFYKDSNTDWYVASQNLLTYNFDTYDIGTLTGAQTIKMSYVYDDGWVSNNGGLHVKTMYTDKITPPLSNRSCFYIPYSNSETAVYQDAAVPLSQTIGYDFNPVLMECGLKITRNGIYSDISVVNEIGNELFADASSDDLSFTVSPCSYLDITVYAGVYSYNRTFRIPLSGEYGVLMPESPAGNVSLLPSYVINTSYYRGEILGIPVIGNMSYGYLDFIDSVSDDTYAMGINLLDTLLYPVHLLNDYMSRAIDTISAVVNDATNAVDVLIQPMVSIVNAIPFKVMNVFIFTLCLDILRILLAWRV